MTGARVRAWWPALLWLALLGTVSSLPGSALHAPVTFRLADKVAHAGLYFVLAALAWRAWVRDPGLARRSGRWAVAVLAAALLLLGAVDEWHQSFIPGRFTDGWDFAADAAGAALGLAAGSRLWRRARETT